MFSYFCHASTRLKIPRFFFSQIAARSTDHPLRWATDPAKCRRPLQHRGRVVMGRTGRVPPGFGSIFSDDPWLPWLHWKYHKFQKKTTLMMMVLMNVYGMGNHPNMWNFMNSMSWESLWFHEQCPGSVFGDGFTLQSVVQRDACNHGCHGNGSTPLAIMWVKQFHKPSHIPSHHHFCRRYKSFPVMGGLLNHCFTHSKVTRKVQHLEISIFWRRQWGHLHCQVRCHSIHNLCQHRRYFDALRYYPPESAEKHHQKIGYTGTIGHSLTFMFGSIPHSFATWFNLFPVTIFVCNILLWLNHYG